MLLCLFLSSLAYSKSEFFLKQDLEGLLAIERSSSSNPRR